MPLSGPLRLKLSNSTGTGKKVNLKGTSLGQDALDSMISPKLKKGIGNRSGFNKINNQLKGSSRIVMKNY